MVVRFLAGLASLSAFFYYYGHDQVLLYGDAVAHINIARRVFDSRTPGPLQLGTVWLPLLHLLILPFVISDWGWRTGILASLPSMAAYVVAVGGIFRLVRDSLRQVGAREILQNGLAGFAAVVFGANPNLLYMQATAMTESLYLSLFIWTVVFLADYHRHVSQRESERASISVMKCALCLGAAMLTRYDGWFACAFILPSIPLATWRNPGLKQPRANAEQRRSRTRIAGAMALMLAAPVLWLAYNGLVFGNPLDFVLGPYSAHGIAARTSPANFHHPGYHNLYVASVYFLRSAEVNVGTGWFGKLWLIVAAAGAILAVTRARALSSWLLLWVPLPFYVLSIAYGEVPIFVPEWWPHSFYNVRYGLELLPAVSVFSAVMLWTALTWARRDKLRTALPVMVAAFLVFSYVGLWRGQPICLREAIANSRTRIALEAELAKQLDRLPPHSTILMYIGDHVGALQRAGIPLRRVIHEGNHGDWKHALARSGLWESALADPNRFADYAVAFDDDAVAQSAQRHNLPAIVIVQSTGQARAAIYQAHPTTR